LDCDLLELSWVLDFDFPEDLGEEAGFGFGRGVGDGVGLLTGSICSRAWRKRRFFPHRLTCPRIAEGISMKHPTQTMMALRFQLRTPQATSHGKIFKTLHTTHA
jgi:hypothetical protein